MEIPVRISSRRPKRPRNLHQRHRNLKYVNIVGREPSKPQQIPQCLVLNARSIVMPDAFSALCADVKTNNIDICRTNRHGGGVAILYRNDWKMESLPNLTNSFECLWVKITTENSIFYVATIYHPPDHMYNPADLVEFLTNSCEQVLSINFA